MHFSNSSNDPSLWRALCLTFIYYITVSETLISDFQSYKEKIVVIKEHRIRINSPKNQQVTDNISVSNGIYLKDMNLWLQISYLFVFKLQFQNSLFVIKYKLKSIN